MTTINRVGQVSLISLTVMLALLFASAPEARAENTERGALHFDNSNLLVNSSFENSLTGWVIEQGTPGSQSYPTGTGNNIDAPNASFGNFCFKGGGSAPFGIVRQTINITDPIEQMAIDEGLVRANIFGWFATYPGTPTDIAWMTVDSPETGASLLDTQAEAIADAPTNYQFESQSSAQILPAGTRTLHFRIIADLEAGVNNNTYADLVTFRLIPVFDLNTIGHQKEVVQGDTLALSSPVMQDDIYFTEFRWDIGVDGIYDVTASSSSASISYPDIETTLGFSPAIGSSFPVRAQGETIWGITVTVTYTVIVIGPTGACCLPLGCMELPSNECDYFAGTFLGAATLCNSNDADGDGTRDECDQCPSDSNKIVPGNCNCNVPEVPTDVIIQFRFGTTGSGIGQFLNSRGVAVDASGRIYVADSGNSRVQVFGSVGNFLFQFGQPGTEPGQFETVTDLVIGQDDRIYVLDEVGRDVHVFDITGNYLFDFDISTLPMSSPFIPLGVAIDTVGLVYVADAGNRMIHVFNPNGTLAFSFGTPGIDPGQLYQPRDIAIDNMSRVHVTEGIREVVVVYDASGNVLFEYGGTGSNDGEFFEPWSIASDGAGRLYVTDLDLDRIQVFDSNGAFLFKFGTPGSGDGMFLSAIGLAIDAYGRIYVADTGANQIQVFDPVTVCGNPCLADLTDNGAMNLPDGTINVFDLLALLSNWGTNGLGADIADPTDIVDVFDLFELLANWGDC